MRRSVEAHLSEVRALLTPLADRLAEAPAEVVAVNDPALAGRVVATALTAPVSLPLFDNSQMDGYAVRSADLAGATSDQPIELAIGRTAAAGDSAIDLAPGTASPVMTGAAIPRGADTVVPIETVRPDRFTSLSRVDDAPPTGTVSFVVQPPRGMFVRSAGEDLTEGMPLLKAGARLTPTRIGVLAASGFTEVPVRPRLQVVVCSTGDEITSDTSAAVESAGLPSGRIYDANSPMLAAALRAAGAQVQVLRSADDPAAFLALLTTHAADADLVVTTGGISAGAFEVVREALSGHGAEFVSIAMQPGGPQGIGRLSLVPSRETPALCFPGNPVSAMLSTEIFLLPFLRELAGLRPQRPSAMLQLAHDVESPADKLQVRRGTRDADGRVRLSAPGSHLLHDFAGAELLAFIPVGVDRLAANTPIDIWSLDD